MKSYCIAMDPKRNRSSQTYFPCKGAIILKIKDLPQAFATGAQGPKVASVIFEYHIIYPFFNVQNINSDTFAQEKVFVQLGLAFPVLCWFLSRQH